MTTAGLDAFVPRYRELYAKLYAGEYKSEIDWQENLKPCTEPGVFFHEYVWVVIHSGMHNKAARAIFDRFVSSNYDLMQIGHEGKRKAVLQVMGDVSGIWFRYTQAEDKLVYLEGLPWIGPITKWHLAKNLGLDCAKPDRHLVRIAGQLRTDPDTLCRHIARAVGQRVATVDLVLWRAANLKML